MTLTQIFVQITGNKNFAGLYATAIRSLEDSGIVKFLRERAKVNYVVNAEVHAVALEGARAAGYQQALDDIFSFTELYIEKLQPQVQPNKMEYGGLELAVARGDLTEEEINAIRSGTPIRYNIIDPKPIPTPTVGQGNS